jgi:hypothetical protein
LPDRLGIKIRGNLTQNTRDYLAADLKNVAMHHDKRFLAMLEEKGVRYQFLSPYSPDMSPIEPAFHQVKAYLKRHYRAGPHNTQRVFEHGLSRVTAAHAANYFRNCNYARTEEVSPPIEEEEAVVAAVLACVCVNERIGLD